MRFSGHWALVGEVLKGGVNILVQRKSAPKGGELNCPEVRIVARLAVKAMQAHLDGESHALTSKIAAVDISSTAGFPDGHDANGLDGGQDLVVRLFPEHPFGLVEKGISSSEGIIGICPYVSPVREAGAES